MPVALITGGSSGIGAAFAHRLAAEGHDLVLAARNKERLDATATKLHDQFGIEVEVISADLSTEDGVALVSDRIKREDAPIDLLVNNSGFGIKGSFLDSPAEDHVEMVRVNVEAVLHLTHDALAVMTKRGHGGIINMSSIAGFTPSIRPSSTYAASKAFVTALTEGLAPTIEDTGVRLTVVCPGFVRTEFHERAGIRMGKLPNFLWLSADQVARTALEDLRSGKTVSVPGTTYKVLLALIRIVPQSLAHRVARRLVRDKH